METAKLNTGLNAMRITSIRFGAMSEERSLTLILCIIALFFIAMGALLSEKVGRRVLFFFGGMASSLAALLL